MASADGVVKRGDAFIVGHAGIFHLTHRNKKEIPQKYTRLVIIRIHCKNQDGTF